MQCIYLSNAILYNLLLNLQLIRQTQQMVHGLIRIDFQQFNEIVVHFVDSAEVVVLLLEEFEGQC